MNGKRINIIIYELDDKWHWSTSSFGTGLDTQRREESLPSSALYQAKNAAMSMALKLNSEALQKQGL